MTGLRHKGGGGLTGVYFMADKEVWMLFQYCARKRGMSSWEAIHPLVLIFIEESFEEKGISVSAPKFR